MTKMVNFGRLGMSIELVVKSPFSKYVVGDHITMAEDIERALEARPMDVIKIERPEPAPPETA